VSEYVCVCVLCVWRLSDWAQVSVRHRSSFSHLVGSRSASLSIMQDVYTCGDISAGCRFNSCNRSDDCDQRSHTFSEAPAY